MCCDAGGLSTLHYPVKRENTGRENFPFQKDWLSASCKSNPFAVLFLTQMHFLYAAKTRHKERGAKVLSIKRCIYRTVFSTLTSFVVVNEHEQRQSISSTFSGPISERNVSWPRSRKKHRECSSSEGMTKRQREHLCRWSLITQISFQLLAFCGLQDMPLQLVCLLFK